MSSDLTWPIRIYRDDAGTLTMNCNLENCPCGKKMLISGREFTVGYLVGAIARHRIDWRI